MATIARAKSGSVRILFYGRDKRRRAISIGRASNATAETIRGRVERFVNAQILGEEPTRADVEWLAKSQLFDRFVRAGLVGPGTETKTTPTLVDFLAGYAARRSGEVKPATLIVWAQVAGNLTEYLPDGILLDQITAGHAKEFHARLKSRYATATVAKRMSIARQHFNDAVHWEILTKNPFSGIKTPRSAQKANVFVERETVYRLLDIASIRWRVIIALSRFGGLRTPSETLSLKWSHVDWDAGRMHVPECKVEHHEGRGVRICPLFPELRDILAEAFEAYGTTSDWVVDAQAYRTAAQTPRGWANANLRTQLVKLCRRANVTLWPRLFHSMRASRQTELERDFPTHVVCSWLGNSATVARQSYLLITEDDFTKATGKTRVLNPTRADQKSVRISTPHTARTQHAHSRQTASIPNENQHIRQLLLTLEVEDRGIELSAQTLEKTKILEIRVPNPTREIAGEIASLLSHLEELSVSQISELVEQSAAMAKVFPKSRWVLPATF